jgi:CRISPR-associated protein Csx10
MVTFRSRIEVESPLAISVGHATGNDLDTRLMIPGTTLRGALAGAYLERNGRKVDDGFKDLFLRKMVRFGDARVNQADPWPLSARECKLEPDRHPRVDLLIGAAAKATRIDCPECSGKRAAPRGFFKKKSRALSSWSEPVHSRRIAHVQIHPGLLRAEHGQFHSARTIEPGQTFFGQIDCSEPVEAALRDLTGEWRHLYLGRGRSRGQGRVRLSLEPWVSRFSAGMEERIRDLNLRAAVVPGFEGKVIFSCTFVSPAILYDDWLFFRSTLDPTDLSADLDSYRATFPGFSRLEPVAGWHAAAGLPKFEAEAICAGSCFLFDKDSAETEREVEYGRLARILAEVERRGIGERRDEGFGEAVICHPFHTENAEAARCPS